MILGIRVSDRMIAVLIGLAFVLLAVVEIRQGSSSPFFISGLKPDFDRDEHPVLFWICVISELIFGLAAIVLGCIFWR